jgi:hypothetical protein
MFGKHVGVAFQLLNDQNSLADDLRDGRRTWALVCAGSKEVLNNPAALAAVKVAQQEHARLALDLVSSLPEVRVLLARALRTEE